MSERRYRRLLALYPRDHRERHGQEMLDVLMAGARPGWRDTADLLWSAFRLHLRRMLSGGVDPRDVLAIVSLLGPVAILSGVTHSLFELESWVRASLAWTSPDALVWTVWLAVAVLAAFRQRVLAAVGAWAGTIGLVIAMADHDWASAGAGWVLLGGLTAVALTLSPGPARGRELAGREPVLVMGAAVVVAVTIEILGYREIEVFAAYVLVLAVGAVAAAGAGTRAGRRAALVLLVPVMTTMVERLMVRLDGFPDIDGTVSALIFYGPPLLFLAVVGGINHRTNGVTA